MISNKTSVDVALWDQTRHL